MEAYVEVIREDGTLERTRIEGEQITVGRSPTAGVPLPDARDLEPEHLLIAPRGEGCWVAIAQGAKIGAKVRGQPFQHGMVEWGSEIEIGGLRFKVTDKPPQEAGKPKQTTSPVVIIAGVLGAVVVIWSLQGDDAVGLETEAPEPYALFADLTACPAPPGTPPMTRATQAAEEALAKSERYPFDPADGLDSVVLYDTAFVCFQAQGASVPAQEMQRERDYMRHRIQEDYDTHRLRMTRALELERYDDALLEDRALLALVRERGEAAQSPYVAWLVRMERQLQLLTATPEG
jgi:hypothetical protein